MNSKSPITHHLLLADQTGFVLLVRNDAEAPYSLPSIQCPSGQLNKDRIASEVALTVRMHITSIESYPDWDSYQDASSYFWVKYKGLLRLEVLEGYWADPMHLVQEQSYPELEKTLQHWGLMNSPAEHILRMNQEIKPPAFLRGMRAGFDYRGVFRNTEILPDDKEQYMQGWKAARKKALL